MQEKVKPVSVEWLRTIMDRHEGPLVRYATRILGDVDRGQPFPPGAMRVPRGKTAGRQRVALPDGYLDDLEDATPPASELAVSGG